MVKSELLNTERAAELLGCRAGQLTMWRRLGRGPKYLKLGGAVLYRRSDLEAFLRASVVTPCTRGHLNANRRLVVGA